MNLSDLTPQSLIFKVVGWIAIIGLIVGALYATTMHFEQVGYDRRISEDQINLNKDLIEAKSKTQNLQHQLNEAQNELSKAKSDLLALTLTNRSYVGKLRDSFNTFDSSVSSQSREALIKRIASLDSVVADCSARLIEVASDADTAIAETKMLEKAWPQ
ncbi:hypothetical protein [Polynucleobacter paneuropaeus]|uniref:hypothetical protein n=1 Tax=Polynucleobacter paneuropaeus TaxID=2527775 RepID=UPI001BFEA5EF|nr:hypothetical protein [Polynucleobacter paneuropaeus]QWD55174.1 hypothetical protein C2750_05410 [Polynucleobacter paneuropaeus]